MNLKKLPSPFFPSICLIPILVLELGGLLLTYKSYKITSEELENILQDLKVSQNIAPPQFFRLAHLKKEYLKEAAELLQAIPQLPTHPITPQIFQDKLRSRVSETMALAQSAGIDLPEDFYLGFDSYRSTLPSHEAASKLERELEAIFYLVNSALKLRVQSISAIYRFVPTEEVCTQGEPSEQAKIFDLCLVADPSALRNLVNSLRESPHFLGMEALQVINNRLPLKKDPSIINSIPHGRTSHNEESSRHVYAKTNFLFKKESLRITLRMVMFMPIQ